jgi:hypothetical protein
MDIFKRLPEKISKFAALHPRAMTYVITVGIALGIALAVSFVLNPHDAFAGYTSGSKAKNV